MDFDATGRGRVVRRNFSFYFMMARTVAKKYWLSGMARKVSRFLSDERRTATTSPTWPIIYTAWEAPRGHQSNQLFLANNLIDELNVNASERFVLKNCSRYIFLLTSNWFVSLVEVFYDLPIACPIRVAKEQSSSSGSQHFVWPFSTLFQWLHSMLSKRRKQLFFYLFWY